MMNNKARITKVKRSPRGNITDVVLENGNVYSVDEAISMAEDGLIEGVDVSRQKKLDELD